MSFLSIKFTGSSDIDTYTWCNEATLNIFLLPSECPL